MSATSHPHLSTAAQWNINQPYVQTLCCGNLRSKLLFKDIPDGWSSGGKWNVNGAAEARCCQVAPVRSSCPASSCCWNRWAGTVWGGTVWGGAQDGTTLGKPQRDTRQTPLEDWLQRRCVPTWEFGDGVGMERCQCCWSKVGVLQGLPVLLCYDFKN